MAERKSDTERKSRRKAPPKIDESEPTGLKKLFENPVVILVFVLVAVVLLLVGIWGLASFLSGG